MQKKILVVDDQPDNVFILQDRLQHEGFKVVTAYDGETSITKTEKENPDLILLDIMMPKMSGLEVCKKLSQNPSTKNIPIIIVTALTSSKDIEEGFNSGAFDYIKKPFNRAELLARINSALRFIETNKLMIELEKVNTFSQTVKKTNHEIKQPLTLITLAVTALKRELQSDIFQKEAAIKRVEFIEKAVKDIISVMESMLNIKNPEVNSFLKNLKLNEFQISSER